jgi:chromosome segregation ATPase
MGLNDDEKKLVRGEVLFDELQVIHEYVQDIPQIKADIIDLKQDVAELKTGMKSVKLTLASHGRQFKQFSRRVAKLETTA